MATKGGKRPGAGRPKGAISKSTRAIVEGAKSAGMLPLDYMLAVMRDREAETGRRDDMAKAAAPYLHPRLASTEVKGDKENPIVHRVEWVIVDPATLRAS